MESESVGSKDVFRSGTLWTATAHIITSLIGAGVLSLAWSVAQLGWIAGPVAMVSFALVTLYSTCLISDCYRFPDPVSGPMRNCSYRDAVRVNLGSRKSWLCTLVQYAFFYGICVAYTITTSISVRAIMRSDCYHKNGHASPCHFPELIYMILFGVMQVILCQIPNFHKLWCLSILAAIMSFTYASIGFVLGMAKVIGIALSYSPFYYFHGFYHCPSWLLQHLWPGYGISISNLIHHIPDVIHLLY